MDPAERFEAIIDAIAVRVEGFGHAEFDGFPGAHFREHALFYYDDAGAVFRLGPDARFRGPVETVEREPEGEWYRVANDRAEQWVELAWAALNYARR